VPRPSKIPLWLRLTFVGVLGFGAFAAWRAYDDHRRRPAPDDPRVTFTVEGLDCPVWCAVRLSDAIDHLDGARVESMDQENGKVVVWHDPMRQNVEQLRALFDARGFAVQATEPVDAPR